MIKKHRVSLNNEIYRIIFNQVNINMQASLQNCHLPGSCPALNEGYAGSVTQNYFKKSLKNFFNIHFIKIILLSVHFICLVEKFLLLLMENLLNV